MSPFAPSGCFAWLVRFAFLVFASEGKSASGSCLLQAKYHSIPTDELLSEVYKLDSKQELHSRFQKIIGRIRDAFSLTTFAIVTSGKSIVLWTAFTVALTVGASCCAVACAITTWEWRRFQSEHRNDADPSEKTSSDTDSKSEHSGTSESCTDSPHRTMLSAFVENEYHESYASGKLYEEYIKDYWARYSFLESPDIFGHDNLRVATDGGMGRVSELKVKYIKAAQVVGTGCLNGFLIVVTDVAALVGHGPKMTVGKDDFLIVKYIARWFLNGTANWDINMLLPALELAFTFYVIVTIVVYSALAIGAPRLSKQHGEMYRWSFASHVAWYCGPQLASCSALRLLYFVTPKILRSDGYRTIVHAWQTISHGGTKRHYVNCIFNIVIFTVSRICALILGFDAFLVKFRLASNALDSGNADFLSALSAATFLWQVAGIINLDWFMRDRGFVFIFAGRDGMLDIDELALVEVWKALLFRKVLGCFGYWRGFVVMLAFDDYDMQFLALDDDEREIHAAVCSRALSSSTFNSRLLASRRGSIESQRGSIESPAIFEA